MIWSRVILPVTSWCEDEEAEELVTNDADTTFVQYLKQKETVDIVKISALCVIQHLNGHW